MAAWARKSSLVVVAALAMSLFALSAAPAVAAPGGKSTATERVIFVGNNWEGTADVLRFKPPDTPGEKGKFTRIARLNIIPDIDQRKAEIMMDPERLAFFLGIRMVVGEGNDQFVDDMYSTNDGRLLVVSRPSLRDVVGICIAVPSCTKPGTSDTVDPGQIVWRFVVAGQRSDHMGVSPDGTRVAVSASTGNVVHILDMATGKQFGTFPSGDSPHENTYSADGSKIFHASIGRVYTPTDQPALVERSTKGDRRFQIVDARTNAIITQIDMGQKLEEAGYPGMSSAVRPMALSPDERFVYFQVSFFHGFVEYDFTQNRVTRVATLPDETRLTHSPVETRPMPRELYVLDSAHHGIAMNAGGTSLCVAGTMSDYAAIVSRETFTDYTLVHGGEKPYWSTTSDDGNHCFVSWSGSDAISAISYADRREVARIDVGDEGGPPAHPQRVRTGVVRRDWVKSKR